MYYIICPGKNEVEAQRFPVINNDVLPIFSFLSTLRERCSAEGWVLYRCLRLD